MERVEYYQQHTYFHVPPSTCMTNDCDLFFVCYPPNKLYIFFSFNYKNVNLVTILVTWGGNEIIERYSAVMTILGCL